MKQFSLVIAMVLFVFSAAFAQKTISGKVTDTNTGEGLIGANVIVKGTSNGAATDLDGSYSLTGVKEGDVLVFSYTGYTEVEQVVGASNTVDVQMSEGIQITEAVVTALGIKRSEKTLPYTAQKLDAQEISVIKTDLNNALAGKVSGIQVRSQSSAKLDGNSAIRIRGVSGLGDKGPLYVVDGTVVSASEVNPDDVESLTVLKGTAAALYGQRGVDGVIVITTKKGSKKKGIGIDFNHATTFDKVYVLPRYQNSYAGGGSADLIQYSWQPGHPEAWKELEGKFYHDYTDDASWGPRMTGQEYLPWYAWYDGTPQFGKTEKLVGQPSNIRDFYETGITNNTNVSLSKGGDGHSFRISLTNIDTKGVLPTSGLNRYVVNGSANMDLTKQVSFGLNVTYNRREITGVFDDGYANQSSGSFNQWFHRHVDMKKLKELRTLKSLDGTFGSWNHNNPGAYDAADPLHFYGGNYWYNMYTWFDHVKQYNNQDNIYGDISVTYKINDKFKISGTSRLNDRVLDIRQYTPLAIEKSAFQTGIFASYAVTGVVDKEINHDFLASYTDKFGVFSVEANVGGAVRKNSYKRQGGNTNNGLSIADLYTLENSKDRHTFEDYNSKGEIRSLYARGTVGYKDFLYLDWTARNDWSSTLLKGNNSYFYPSFGATFVFSELLQESFPALSYGKLRGAYSAIGTDTEPYATEFTYPLGADKWGDNPTMTTPNILPDANLRPAISKNIEFGVDLKFLNGRYGLSATYFDDHRTDQILLVALTGASGYTHKRVNAGDIYKSGIELELGIIPVKSRDFTWESTLNYSKISNKILELADPTNNNEALVQETGTFGTSSGVVLVHKEGEQWGQIRGGGIKRNSAGVPLLNENGTFQLQSDTYFGSALPDFTGGWFNGFSYKNFVLNTSIEFSKGGKYYSLSDFWGKFSGLFAETGDVNDKGNPVRDAVADGGGIKVTGIVQVKDSEGNVIEEKPSASYYIDAFTYYHQFRNTLIAENSIFDMSFIKLREVSLGYQLPLSKWGVKWAQNATVSFVARNPWLIYAKNRDFDPSEISNTYGENGQFPGTRSFGFNVKLGF